MSDKIVHIGYPKTGTTFLQKVVFPTVEGFSYVDYPTCVRLFEDIIYLDQLDYDHQKQEEKFASYLKGKTLFSQEALTGAPFTFKGLNRSQIPERLKSLGFSKVIITIRNQVDVLDSLYRQYIYQGGVLRFKDFLNLDGKWNHYIRPFDLDYLKYSGLINLYFEVFGRSNVLVLPQEILRNDETQYFDQLGTFVGGQVNVTSQSVSNESLTNASTNLLRFINHFTFNSQRPNQLLSNHISTRTIKKVFQVVVDPYFFKLLSKKRSYLKGQSRDRIVEYYSQSNFELRKLVDFNITELGYRTA